MRAIVILIGVAFALQPIAGHGQSTCPAPAPVCAAKASVFPIASFDPQASAVLIAPDLLVTNRHVVADNPRAEIFGPDGSRLMADVVPTIYPGDLVLLTTKGLAAPGLPIGTATLQSELRTVAADVGRGRIRVYSPGRAQALPAEGKLLARLHNTARSQPGNSGGALVDAKGRLVGIVTSGGEGRSEAIPASDISRLKEMSGPEHALASRNIGLAYRQCTEAIDVAGATRQAMAPKNIQFIAARCRATNNRQLLDLAAQALGRRGHHAQSIELFNAALAQDPNALNTRLGLVVTLHLARRFKDELPHLHHLIDVMPREIQVLRFAVQAGTWGGDKALADQGVALLKKHHPKLAPLAERFMKAPPPSGGPRRP